MIPTTTAIVSSAGATITVALVDKLDDVGQAIVLAAAVGAAIGWTFAKVIRPMVTVLKRTYEAVDALEELPHFMEETKKRLDRNDRIITQMTEVLGITEDPVAEGER